MSDGQLSPGPVVNLDPKGLKALAHPLRMHILSVLRVEGSSTATLLAKRLGENSGATSYHLRQLARSGFIEEVEDRGTGRERWWRAAHSRINADVPENLGDPETQSAWGVYLREVVEQAFRQVEAWLSQEIEWDREWVESTTFSNFLIHLTPVQLRRLRSELIEVIENYRAAEDRDAEGLERVAIYLQAFPYGRLALPAREDE